MGVSSCWGIYALDQQRAALREEGSPRAGRRGVVTTRRTVTLNDGTTVFTADRYLICVPDAPARFDGPRRRGGCAYSGSAEDLHELVVTVAPEPRA
jgi:hypothetical protein